jgi:hypothetical protein
MSFFILKKPINSVEKLLIFHIFFLLCFINTKKKFNFKIYKNFTSDINNSFKILVPS